MWIFISHQWVWQALHRIFGMSFMFNFLGMLKLALTHFKSWIWEMEISSWMQSVNSNMRIVQHQCTRFWSKAFLAPWVNAETRTRAGSIGCLGSSSFRLLCWDTPWRLSSQAPSMGCVLRNFCNLDSTQLSSAGSWPIDSFTLSETAGSPHPLPPEGHGMVARVQLEHSLDCISGLSKGAATLCGADYHGSLSR